MTVVAGAEAGSLPAIRIETPDGGPHRVQVAGLPPATLAALARAPASELAVALAVFTGIPGPDVPAILGQHSVDESGLHFQPRFPFVTGVSYTAQVRLGDVRLTHTFEVAAPKGVDPPRVVAVHPSGDTLPENTLRLYVHFSRPMSARGVHRHLRLLGPDGAEVPLAFVEIEEGLWNPAQTRLTLFFHPGRVKRAVAPGERLGPPLRAGREYRLRIDAALADAAGVPMGEPYERHFRAVAADRESPRAADLRVQPPSSPRAPASVTLGEPLDEALLRRWLWIEDAEGRAVRGRVEIDTGETRWTFVPDEAWAPGRYAVRFRAGLEDRAGNRFDRLFDRDGRAAADAATGAAQSDIFSLPFAVAGPE